MLSEVRRAAMTPLWLAQVATGAKSFERNLVIGSRHLNESGLHAARVNVAYKLAGARRPRLAGMIFEEDRAAFDPGGVVVRPGVMPEQQISAPGAPIRASRRPRLGGPDGR